MQQQFGPHDIFISPLGNDAWTGRTSSPSADASDGPLKTLSKARQILRERKVPNYGNPSPAYSSASGNAPSTVWLRGGRYELSSPFTLTPEDSAPVTYAAYPGETPCIDGGTEITGLQEGNLNGTRVWIAEIPEVRDGSWFFTQLWVDDKRAERPRLPKEGLYRMEEGFHGNKGWNWHGSDRFIAAPGEFDSFLNLQDVEAVVLHFWIEERMPIESYDPETRLVVSSRISYAPLSWSFGPEQAPYYLDNVFEALELPGQWYLDRPSGKLYYIPRDGQAIDEVRIYAPRISRVLDIQGDAEAGHHVEWIRFRGITFQHTAGPNPLGLDVPGGGPPHDLIPPKQKPRAAAPQAAYHIPGAVRLECARHCGFEDCTFKHLGWYALELGHGCTHIDIVGNEITDIGAGGIKVGGGKFDDPQWQHTGHIKITDNHIHRVGNIYHSGTGVQIRHAGENLIAHNHIHHLYYSAISVGWTWGYKHTVSHNNIVEYNLLHDIGQGLLSDMGGVYLLGVAPGTVVRNNIIHTVKSAHYGGWGIYPDEGSSHLVIENNICYDANCEPFHQHYGRENTVRNNIFAFGNEAVFALSKSEDCRALSIVNNIFVSDGKPIFCSGHAHKFTKRADATLSDLNLFWDTAGEVTAVKEKAHTTADLDSRGLTMKQWQALGLDLHSVVADPRFADLEERDFTLADDSPALALGFKAIDVSGVGIRPRESRLE